MHYPMRLRLTCIRLDCMVLMIKHAFSALMGFNSAPCGALSMPDLLHLHVLLHLRVFWFAVDTIQALQGHQVHLGASRDIQCIYWSQQAARWLASSHEEWLPGTLQSQPLARVMSQQHQNLCQDTWLSAYCQHLKCCVSAR